MKYKEQYNNAEELWDYIQECMEDGEWDGDRLLSFSFIPPVATKTFEVARDLLEDWF